MFLLPVDSNSDTKKNWFVDLFSPYRHCILVAGFFPWLQRQSSG